MTLQGNASILYESKCFFSNPSNSSNAFTFKFTQSKRSFPSLVLMLRSPFLFPSLFLLHRLFINLDPFLPDQPPLEIHLISPLLILLILPQKLKQLVLII